MVMAGARVSDAVQPDWAARVGRLSLEHPSGPLDALVVSTPVNLRYLTGFDASAGLLIVTRSEARLMLDGRYLAAARRLRAGGKMFACDVHHVDGAWAPALAKALRGAGLKRAGIEAASVTVATLESWRRAAPELEFVPTERAVEDQRVVKDDFEIGILRRAGRLLSDVAAELPHLVSEGTSEIDIARAIDRELEHRGFSGPAFPTIVASGPNSALPHARPTTRRPDAGDLVLLDFGGVLDGYCVDLSRVLVIGHPTEDAVALFDAVRAAQQAALAAVAPGRLASEVDAAARGALEARGLGPAFLHATGHGLGLEVHEAPRVGRAGESAGERLAAGMVITVEPGAYVDGVGGVRLEDDVLVVPGGHDLLTDAPRELLRL